MSRRRLLAGNWKMNKSISELPAFFEAFAKEAGLDSDGGGRNNRGYDVLFAVHYTLLARASELAKPLGIIVAAQNVHFEASGAFTGEVSIAMLKELGVTWTLIGHSERRQYFAETDESVAKKVRAALNAGMTPVICVGETRQERETGVTKVIVGRQLDAALAAAAGDVDNIVLAYEPVWAIGTGLSATSAQAQEVHSFIRERMAEKCGPNAAKSVRILYGGSATPANIDELMGQPDIDGGLVGGASLKPADFAKMARVVSAGAC